MQRCLHALFTVVIALCVGLLVAVPRFFLLPPVPVGIVAHNMHRLPLNKIGEAKANTSKRYRNEEFFVSGGHEMRLLSFKCINDHQDSNDYSQCSRPMMFNDNK